LLLRELPIAGTTADINLDGMTSIADWELFVVNSFTNLAGLTQRQKFERGDLDLDGDNDRADFQLFKSLFNTANGPSSFDRLLGVPEPGALALAGMAAIAAIARRKRAA
jgi:serralysin